MLCSFSFSLYETAVAARSISSALCCYSCGRTYTSCGQQSLAPLSRVPLLAKGCDVQHLAEASSLAFASALRLWLFWNLFWCTWNFRYTSSFLLSIFDSRALKVGLLAEDLRSQGLQQQGPKDLCHHTHEEGEDHHLVDRDAHGLVRALRTHSARDLRRPHLSRNFAKCGPAKAFTARAEGDKPPLLRESREPVG